MPRKTDANNPADWLWIAERDLAALKAMSAQELGYELCRGKLAEVLEKVFKAELIRLGWALVKTHDLLFLAKELRARQSDLVVAVESLVTSLAEAYMMDRYPGFDFDDPDWPALRAEVEQVAVLLKATHTRLGADPP